MVELPTAAEAIVGELRPADREALKIAAAQLRERGAIHPDTQKQLRQVIVRAQGIFWDIMHDDARPSDYEEADKRMVEVSHMGGYWLRVGLPKNPQRP